MVINQHYTQNFKPPDIKQQLFGKAASNVFRKFAAIPCLYREQRQMLFTKINLFL